MSIPDLELEANSPDANDARAEEMATPGTPAFEFREARALHEDLRGPAPKKRPMISG